MPDLVEQLQDLKELRRRGSLSAAQFEAAKAYLLRDVPAEAVPLQIELELQTELAALDNHWMAEREQFKVQRGFFSWIPRKNDGKRKARFVIIFGSLLTAFFVLLSIGVTLHHGARTIWMSPLFGIGWTWSRFSFYTNLERMAADYERAEAKYYAERAQIEAKLRAPGTG